MSSHESSGSKPDLSDALALMARALEILDRVGAPATIGAPLDLALSTLSDLPGEDERPSAGVQSLMEEDERAAPPHERSGDGPNPWNDS